MAISESIKYIGASTHDLDLFEGQYTVPNGMAYNSYLIDDEKIFSCLYVLIQNPL